MVVAQSIVGALFLIFGRDMDWLFISGTGFLAGLYYAPVFFPDSPVWVYFTVAAILAILGFFILTRQKLNLPEATLTLIAQAVTLVFSGLVSGYVPSFVPT